MRTQGLGALAPQPVGPSSQLGKEQTLPDAEDPFSQYGVGFGQSDSAPQAGTRSVLNCLNTFKNRTAAPVKQFQRLLGHMAGAVTPLGLLQMRDCFNTGSMAESRGGRGRAARCGSKSLQSAAKPSPRGQTFCSFGQECPWNRSPGTLWFTRMPPPRAGGPRSTGLQCRGFGRVPNCTGTLTA